MDYIKKYLEEVSQISGLINKTQIETMVIQLSAIKESGGRIFFLGIGGGAANASHAVNDFRKICGIEAYTPVDNVSELTARINDEGWENIFVNWLKGSKCSEKDGIFVLSVGGGNIEKNISLNLVEALKYAKQTRIKIFGIVGRDGGYTAKVADSCVIIPFIDPGTITPHTEAFQAVVWHLIVSHPKMKAHEMKWESIK